MNGRVVDMFPQFRCYGIGHLPAKIFKNSIIPILSKNKLNPYQYRNGTKDIFHQVTLNCELLSSVLIDLIHLWLLWKTIRLINITICPMGNACKPQRYVIGHNNVFRSLIKWGAVKTSWLPKRYMPGVQWAHSSNTSCKTVAAHAKLPYTQNISIMPVFIITTNALKCNFCCTHTT